MARLFITNRDKKLPDSKNYRVIRSPICEANNYRNDSQSHDTVTIEGDSQISKGNKVYISMNNSKVLYTNRIFTLMIYGDPNFNGHYDGLTYYVTNNDGVITDIKVCN